MSNIKTKVGIFSTAGSVLVSSLNTIGKIVGAVDKLAESCDEGAATLLVIAKNNRETMEVQSNNNLIKRKAELESDTETLIEELRANLEKSKVEIETQGYE